MFTDLVQKPEEDIQLDRAALYLAGEEYPELDVPSHLAQLDKFAIQVSARVNYEATPSELAHAIAGYLFTEVGFHGIQGSITARTTAS